MKDAVALLHSVRTAKGLPAEPVGIWYLDELGMAVPWYPPEHEILRDKGWKSLQGPTQTMLDWARYRSKTSPNWRIIEESDLLPELQQEALEALYQTEHDAWSATVALKKYTESEIRTRNKHLDAAVGEQSKHSGWGANRIVNAQSWWIASELVRRNPSLAIYETHPADGTYDVLCVTTPEAMAEDSTPKQVSPKVMLNRVGTAQLHVGSDMLTLFSWNEVLSAPDPHALIKRIELAAGWEPHLPAVSSERALAYRFMASALTLTQNARIQWDVRMTYTYEGRPCAAEAFVGFPTAADAPHATPTSGGWSEPYCHFWRIRRGNNVVAVVSDKAELYGNNGKLVSLRNEYVGAHRRLEPVVLGLLGKFM